MGTDLRYSLINSFRSIDTLRANQAFNLLGSFVPGFRPRDISMGMIATDQTLSSNEPAARRAPPGTDTPARSRGTRVGVTVTDYELSVVGYRQRTVTSTPTRTQGSNTSLSIIGEGFFAVSDGLSEGSKVYFTRNGRFAWKAVGSLNGDPVYRLVNDQGLFVLRAKDIRVNSNTGVSEVAAIDKAELPLGNGMAMVRGNDRNGAFTDTLQTFPGRIRGLIGESEGGDMSKVANDALPRYFSDPKDNESQLAIVKVPGSAQLVNSSFGPEVLSLPPAGGRGVLVASVDTWFRREGAGAPKVLPDSLEFLDQKALQDRIVIENEAANFVYRTLSTFLQDYNRSIDDLLGIIR